jgi:hypothetical protein
MLYSGTVGNEEEAPNWPCYIYIGHTPEQCRLRQNPGEISDTGFKRNLSQQMVYE